jgi:methionyl-tRNA formyltransferase
MTEKLKIVLIVATTSGKVVFDYFKKNKFVDLTLVITFPDDKSVPRHEIFPHADNIVKTDSANNYAELIVDSKPDYIFVEGWSELLSQEILNCPKHGVIGFHPSKLPNDRGRSVLAWQIEENYTESAVTMFYYNNFPDGGDIIGQELFKIEFNDYITNILDKLDSCVHSLITSYFPLIRQGIAPRKKQNINEGNFRRLRNENDSMIDWNDNSLNIYNKIRAISEPYPLAIAKINNELFKVKKSQIIHTFPYGEELRPGDVVAKLFDDSLIVKTRDSFIRLIYLSKK